MAEAGAKVEINYRSLGPDIERHWGTRGTVAQDYLRDQPPMIGDVRIGPDLANVGTRHANRTWLLWHLYNPRLSTADEEMPSLMPPYPFLFEKRKAGPKPSPGALNLPGGTVEKGFEVF